MECNSTDSYRLARKIIQLSKESEENYNIVIPSHNIVEFCRIMDEDPDSKVEVHIFNNKVIFKFNSIIMMSRLINGTYPDTSKLIPTEFMLTVRANLDQLYTAIDRASLLTNEADKNTIRLESSNNLVIVSSNIPEIGNVEEKIEVQKDQEADIKIAFSSKFMMDALKSLDCEEVSLLFNGEVKPIIIKNLESDDLIQLILPIRTY